MTFDITIRLEVDDDSNIFEIAGSPAMDVLESMRLLMVDFPDQTDVDIHVKEMKDQ